MAPITTTPKKAAGRGRTSSRASAVTSNSALEELLRNGNMLHVQNLYVINTDHHPGPIILQQGIAGQPVSLSPAVNIKKEKQVKTPAKAASAKKKKVLGTPKGAMNAFFWFARENRSLIRDAFPEYRHAEVTKEVGRQWAALEKDDKKKYEALADEDKVRYHKEMDELKGQNTNHDDIDDLYD